MWDMMGRFMHLPDPWSQPIMSIADAGQVLHMSRSAAYRSAAAGAIPTVAVGQGRRMVPTAGMYRMLGLPLPHPARTEAPRIVSLP